MAIMADKGRRIVPYGAQRYQLTSKNPLTGKTVKFCCPQCGQKGKFSRYWDHFAGDWSRDTLAGRCDRVNSCGYEKFPDKDTSSRTRHFRHTVHTQERAETALVR